MSRYLFPKRSIFGLAPGEKFPTFERIIEVDLPAKPVEGQPGVYVCDVPKLATMCDITVVNPIFDNG